MLTSPNYNQTIDIWAIGCIMAELFIQGPIFGGSSEKDQLNRILNIFGIPSHKEWSEFHQLCQRKQFLFNKTSKISLDQVITNASSSAIDFMKKLFTLNPFKRISANLALKHTYMLCIDSYQTQSSQDSYKRIQIQNEINNQQNDEIIEETTGEQIHSQNQQFENNQLSLKVVHNKSNSIEKKVDFQEQTSLNQIEQDPLQNVIKMQQENIPVQ